MHFKIESGKLACFAIFQSQRIQKVALIIMQIKTEMCSSVTKANDLIIIIFLALTNFFQLATSENMIHDPSK